MQPIGDMARSLLLRSEHTRLKTEMDTLATEIATGFVKDPAAHLQGDVAGLLSIDMSIERLETYRINNNEATILSQSMQTTLDQLQSRSDELSNVLLSSELTPSPAFLATMSRDAGEALESVIGGLNRSVAGRFLFSGTATDRAPLENAETLLDDLRPLVSGETSVAGVQAQLDAWFDTPGGGFESSTYQGSVENLSPIPLSDSESADIDIRADNQAFRDLLKSLAMAALAADPTSGLSPDGKVEALRTAGLQVRSALESVTELRSGLGSLEARIEETGARNESERTATQIARLDLVGTDQYETASRYESIRGQLESLYAITARSQRLSLAGYL